MADHSIGYLFLAQLLPGFCPSFARHCPARESYDDWTIIFLRVKTAAQLNRREIIVPVCWTPTGYAKLNKGVSNVIKDKLHFNVFLMLSISIRMYIPPKWRPISKETTLALWWKVRPSVSTTSGRAGHHTPVIDKTIYASGIHFKTFSTGGFSSTKIPKKWK